MAASAWKAGGSIPRRSSHAAKASNWGGAGRRPVARGLDALHRLQRGHARVAEHAQHQGHRAPDPLPAMDEHPAPCRELLRGEGRAAVHVRLGQGAVILRGQVQQGHAVAGQRLGIVAILRPEVDHRADAVGDQVGDGVGRKGAADRQGRRDPVEVQPTVRPPTPRAQTAAATDVGA